MVAIGDVIVVPLVVPLVDPLVLPDVDPLVDPEVDPVLVPVVEPLVVVVPLFLVVVFDGPCDVGTCELALPCDVVCVCDVEP